MANVRTRHDRGRQDGQRRFCSSIPRPTQTEVVIDGFPKTVHELLVVPETGLAYVPIFGDGIHGRNPNPQHHLCVFDLHKRALAATIDLFALYRPAYAQARARRLHLHHLRELGGGGGDRPRQANKVVEAIDSGSTNGHRLIIAPDGERLYTENEEDATVSVIDLPKRKLLGKINTPRPLAGIAISPDGRTVIAVDDAQPTLFLIDTEAGKVREELALKDVPKAGADRALRAGQQPARRHQPQQRYREPDRSVVWRADRDQGRLAADGHGVPRRRIVRRLPGRRLGACHRYSRQAPQVEFSSRHRLRVAGIFLTSAPKGRLFFVDKGHRFSY